jgi:hypothetical protein
VLGVFSHWNGIHAARSRYGWELMTKVDARRTLGADKLVLQENKRAASKHKTAHQHQLPRFGRFFVMTTT